MPGAPASPRRDSRRTTPAPTSSPRRGERRCRRAPDRCCALSGCPRASPSDPPAQAPKEGVGCGQRNDHEHERPDARLRVRPFPAIIDPAGTMASADCSAASRGLSAPAVPHHPAIHTGGASGTPAEPSEGKSSNLPRTPHRVYETALMTSGFASWCRLARTVPPSTRSPSRSPSIPTRHVFLGSRFRLRLPCHPVSRLRSCPRLVVGAINLHRGLAPPSCWSCLAHTVRGSPAHGSPTFFTAGIRFPVATAGWRAAGRRFR
jgi:hypothetical protein